MRNRKPLAGEPETSEINVSPLIDMVFILLIFFIVTTVFVEETGVDVDTPRAASAVDLERESILIAITASGEVVYGGREIGPGGVRPIVRRILRQEDRPVILQVDEAAAAGLVVRVIDEAKLGGATAISISADP